MTTAGTLLGLSTSVQFQRFLRSLPTIGLSAALAALLGACTIAGPPDGFFDEGEGGYSAGEDSHEGGSAVVGEPTSTTGITEEAGDEGNGLEDGDDGDDPQDGLQDADLLPS